MNQKYNQNFEVTTGIVYFGTRDPIHYIYDLEEILTHHCNFVIHPVSEEDIDLYHKSLAEIFDITKKAGLVVIVQPWSFGNVFNGYGGSKFVLEHRECWQILSNSQSVPAACMNNPEFATFLKQWINRIVELGADGIVWENPHYYIFKNDNKLLQWGCWCNYCKKLYLQKFYHRLPKGIGEEIKLLNECTIASFLKELCDYSKKKHLINIVCLSPIYAKNLSMSSWHLVCEIPTLDIFAANAYWYYSQFNADSFVKGVAKKLSSVCDEHKKKSQLWIQNFRIIAGEEKHIKRAIEICLNEKIDSLVGWSYYGSRVVSALRCQNPRVVWDILGDMFKRFVHNNNSLRNSL